MQPILVEEYRGESLECTHAGHICGVDETGQIRYAVGDPRHVTFLRSAAKPFQAIPAIRNGIDLTYGFTERESAIMAGSHRGEAYHIDAVDSMLRKIGMDDEKFVCACTYPLNVEARDQLLRLNKPKRRAYHNCSGKHTGVLALCKGMGYSTNDYFEPHHPAQRQILETLALLSETAVEDISTGTDGCGFPTFALPLSGLAKAFLKLACPELIADSGLRNAAAKVAGLMNAYPEMVAGTDFICTALLQDSNIVAKGGAKGIYAFGLKKERLAFALKVTDGSEEEWPLIVARILEQIGYGNASTIERLYRISNALIKNDSQKPVGSSRAVFSLEPYNEAD